MTIFLSIVTSSLTRRLLPVLVAAGLIAGFWDNLLRALGIGIALLISVAAVLIWAIWQRRLPPFLRRWNWCLGAVAFAAALLGILAFFNPGDGIFNEENVSLGGSWGLAINRDQGSAGVVIVIALAVVGIACVGPRITWRLLRSGAKKIVPALQQLKEWGQRGIEWLREFYREHPIHEMIRSRLKKRREIPIREIPFPQPTFEPPSKMEEGVKEMETTPKEAAPSAAPRAAPPHLVLSFPGRWQLPSVELLDETARVELSQDELEKRARLIEESLASYGVEAKVIQINVGPAVTQFGVEPGWDRRVKEIKERDKSGNLRVRSEEVARTRVKVERISSLQNDLSLALAAPSIRIEAPIPGTSLVGIEVPNSAMGVVSAREVMESADFKRLSSRVKLAVAVGRGSGGEEVVKDLARMPHLLIAGATGSGKTVCLNCTIASLLTNNTPEDLRFIMIDPKRVELIAFNGVPHLMTPVVTESEKAVEMLEWGNHEMDSRYRRLAMVGAHNIERYNSSSKVSGQMPYIVVVIDELADLMMAKSEEVEPRLCRLAQMGRAVGIHLVVATQRPSVDVITGLIKANFPTRISFAVVSQVDSRTILDMAGAEKLLGRGDMLFLSADAAKPKRVQGCFISPDEIERVVNFLREQAKFQPPPSSVGVTEEDARSDPLLDQARRLARQHTQISSSFLQRQLRIGYARAERLMQLIQEEGRDKSDRKDQP
ncbi:MAG: DNA translocase FtsK [Dehalococcoidia bacterium]|nr:DNA translocase FtsK [Dehalococcoidia bacterium]